MNSAAHGWLGTLSLLVLLVAPFSLQAAELRHMKPPESGTRSIVVEHLTAEFYPESGVVTVNARIRNNARHIIKGYATIYLLSAEGQTLSSFQEEINNGDTFDHGALVEFSASSKVGTLDRVSSISVDFTHR